MGFGSLSADLMWHCVWRRHKQLGVKGFLFRYSRNIVGDEVGEGGGFGHDMWLSVDTVD